MSAANGFRSDPLLEYSENAVTCRIGWDACHHLSIKNRPTLTMARDRRQSIRSNRMCLADHWPYIGIRLSGSKWRESAPDLRCYHYTPTHVSRPAVPSVQRWVREQCKLHAPRS